MRPSKVRSPRRINTFFQLKTMWVFSSRSQICPTEKRGLSRSVERFARIGSIDWEILMEADPDDGMILGSLVGQTLEHTQQTKHNYLKLSVYQSRQEKNSELFIDTSVP